jgi:hypothetical protein
VSSATSASVPQTERIGRLTVTVRPGCVAPGLRPVYAGGSNAPDHLTSVISRPIPDSAISAVPNCEREAISLNCCFE